MRKIDRAKYDEKRQHILEAADECFQRNGFRGATIGDICAAARMSPGHLYHYFDSKEAIIEAIFESRLERATAVVGEVTPNDDLITALCEWLVQRMKEVRARGSSLGLEMSAESARNPTIAKISARADRGVRQLLSRLICEGQEREQVDPSLDPDSAAAVLHSIIFGLNRLGNIRDSTFDVKAASDMLKLLLERFLKPAAMRTAKQLRPTVHGENGRKMQARSAAGDRRPAR